MATVKIKDVTDYLENWAPKSLQEDYDNSGLLTGNQLDEVTGILITLDCTEEVLEEVFVKIWKKIDQYNPSQGMLYTWMLTMARDISISKLIDKNVNNNPKNLYLDDFVHLLNIKTNYVSKVDSIGIQEFTRRLKPKCIQIIDIIFFKGYSQQEVAKELAIPLETVQTHNRSCMINLRNYLKI